MRIQLCSEKICASAWDSNGVNLIANQVVRQVPQYLFPSHSTASALPLLQAALPFASPGAVIKGATNMPARMCHPHPASLDAPKEIPGAFSRSLWMSREEEPGEVTGTGYGLFGVVSQARDLQSEITSCRKNLRSKCFPQMYPLFTGGWE